MAIQSSEQNISASDNSFDDDPIRFVNLEAINRIICRETECNAPSDSTDSLRRRPPSVTPKGAGSKFLFGDGNRHIDSIAELNIKIGDLGIEEAIHENSNFSVGTNVDFVASSNTEYPADMEMEGYNCCSSAEIITQCNRSTNQGLSEMFSSSELDVLVRLVTNEETGYHTPKATNGHSFCKLTEQESCGNCSSFEPVSSFAKQKRDSHGPVQKVLFSNITQREECGTCDPPESQCQKPTKMPGFLEKRINKMQLALKQSSAQKKIKHNGVIDVSYLHTDISSFQAQKNTADKLKLKKQNIQRKTRKNCHKNKIGPLHDDQDENISGVSSVCMVQVRRSTRLRSRQLELCKGVKNSASSTLVLEQMANRGTGDVSNISSDMALKCGEAALFIDKKERQTKKCRKSSVRTSNVTSESDGTSMNYHSKNSTKTHTNNEGLEHTKAEGRCRTELQSREVGSHGGSAKAEKPELPLQLDSDNKTRKVPSQLDSDNGQRALRVVTVNNMKQMKPKKKKMITSSVIAFRKAEKTLIERRKKKKKNLQAKQDWEHLKDAGMTWIPEVRCNTRGRPKSVKHCEESTYPLHAKPMAPSKADKLRICTSLKPSKSRTSTKRNAMSLDIDRECNLKQNMGLQDNQGTAISGAAACRRSTRIRSRPLEYWKGERFLQGRIYDSLPTVIGIKYAAPELPKKRNHSGNMKVESFVSTKYSALLRFAAQG